MSAFKKYNLLLLIFIEAILVVWGLSGTDDLFSFLMAANVFVMYLSVSFSKYSTESLLARFLPYAILLPIIICVIQYFNYNIKKLHMMDMRASYFGYAEYAEKDIFTHRGTESVEKTTFRTT